MHSRSPFSNVLIDTNHQNLDLFASVKFRGTIDTEKNSVFLLEGETPSSRITN